MSIFKQVTACENEVLFRKYHCTRYQSLLLSTKADGYLYITNQRVILRADGTSPGGASIIQSEIAIADVAGVSFYKGNYFSLLSFFLGVVAASLASSVALVLAGLLARSGTGGLVIAWLIGLTGIIVSIKPIPRNSIWWPVCAYATANVFMAIAMTSLVNSMSLNSYLQNYYGNGGSSARQVFAVFALIIGLVSLGYSLYALISYSRRVTFSMNISSKSGMSSPITISGMSGLGVANSAAPKALQAEPTIETEYLIRDLGSMIMDIKKYGDAAASKWQLAYHE